MPVTPGGCPRLLNTPLNPSGEWTGPRAGDPHGHPGTERLGTGWTVSAAPRLGDGASGPKGPPQMDLGDPWAGPLPPQKMDTPKGPAGPGTSRCVPPTPWGWGDPSQGLQERDLRDPPGTPKPGLGSPPWCATPPGVGGHPTLPLPQTVDSMLGGEGFTVWSVPPKRGVQWGGIPPMTFTTPWGVCGGRFDVGFCTFVFN